MCHLLSCCNNRSETRSNESYLYFYSHTIPVSNFSHNLFQKLYNYLFIHVGKSYMPIKNWKFFNPNFKILKDLLNHSWRQLSTKSFKPPRRKFNDEWILPVSTCKILEQGENIHVTEKIYTYVFKATVDGIYFFMFHFLMQGKY